jgi:hypothetical protein
MIVIGDVVIGDVVTVTVTVMCKVIGKVKRVCEKSRKWCRVA